MFLRVCSRPRHEYLVRNIGVAEIPTPLPDARDNENTSNLSHTMKSFSFLREPLLPAPSVADGRQCLECAFLRQSLGNARIVTCQIALLDRTVLEW